MKGFLVRSLFLSLILAGLTAPVLARDLTLVEDGDIGFSHQIVEDLRLESVVVNPLPNVSPETIGITGPKGLGVDMWGDTHRAVAEILLGAVEPSRSPVLNDLVRRLLMTAATPPAGETASTRSLTSSRVEKLARFGASDKAWALARQADAGLVDAPAFFLAAESALAQGDESICEKAQEYARARPGDDGRKLFLVCQLRGNDYRAAQVALDVFRAATKREDVFLTTADRNVLAGNKTLPPKFAVASFDVAALLQVANLSVPDTVFAASDASFAGALLRIKGQKDAPRLELGERAASRGLTGVQALADLYMSVAFVPDVLANAEKSDEKGPRLRALLFRAAQERTKPADKILLAVRFIESCSVEFMNRAGAVVAMMLKDIEADSAYGQKAALLARAYMAAGQKGLAADWLDVSTEDAAFYDVWPQAVLAGVIGEKVFEAEFSQWFEHAIKSADKTSVQDYVEPALMYMKATGFNVPAFAWKTVFRHTPKATKQTVSPIAIERLRAAARARNRAETVLLALAVVGDKEPSMIESFAVVDALRQTGLVDEARSFAREQAALSGKGL